MSSETRSKSNTSSYNNRLNTLNSGNGATASQASASNQKVEKSKRSCWGCGSESHMLAQCPNPNKSKTEVNKTVKAKVNACTVQSSSMLSRHDSIVATDGRCEVKRDGCTVTTATDGLVSQVPVTDDGGAMVRRCGWFVE